MAIDASWVEAASAAGGILITIAGAVWKLHADKVKQAVQIEDHGKRIEAIEKGQEAQNRELGLVKEGVSRMEGKLDEGFRWIRDSLANLGRHRDEQ